MAPDYIGGLVNAPGWSVAVVVFLGCAALAAFYTVRAGRNMAPSVADPFAEFFFRRGVFAGRAYFTERGWRFRSLALRFLGGAAATLVVWVLWAWLRA